MNIHKMLLLAVIVIFPWTIAAEAQKEDAVKEEMKKLQGVWQVTKFIDHSEQPAPPDELKDHTFEFKADNVTQRKDKEFPGRSMKYTLNPSKKPKQMNMEEGRVLEGIYKLEGDELFLCFVGGMRGGKVTPRPTEFKASKNPPHSLLVLKKAKK